MRSSQKLEKSRLSKVFHNQILVKIEEAKSSFIQCSLTLTADVVVKQMEGNNNFIAESKLMADQTLKRLGVRKILDSFLTFGLDSICESDGISDSTVNKCKELLKTTIIDIVYLEKYRDIFLSYINHIIEVGEIEYIYMHKLLCTNSTIVQNMFESYFELIKIKHEIQGTNAQSALANEYTNLVQDIEYIKIFLLGRSIYLAKNFGLLLDNLNDDQVIAVGYVLFHSKNKFIKRLRLSDDDFSDNKELKHKITILNFTSEVANYFFIKPSATLTAKIKEFTRYLNHMHDVFTGSVYNSDIKGYLIEACSLLEIYAMKVNKNTALYLKEVEDFYKRSIESTNSCIFLTIEYNEKIQYFDFFIKKIELNERTNNINQQQNQEIMQQVTTENTNQQQNQEIIQQVITENTTIKENRCTKRDSTIQIFNDAQTRLNESLKKSTVLNTNFIRYNKELIECNEDNTFGAFSIANTEIKVYIRENLRYEINQYKNSSAIIERIESAIAKGFVAANGETGIKKLLDNKKEDLKIGSFLLCEIKLLGKAKIGNIEIGDYRVICAFDTKSKVIYALEEALGHHTMQSVIENVIGSLEYSTQVISSKQRKGK